MCLQEFEHTRGTYAVINRQIVDKYNHRLVNNPAILLDLKYGCVHRIDEAEKLKRDYPKLIQQLRQIGKKYVRYVIPIEYDSSEQEASWNFNEQNKMYLSVDEVCTLMNFITMCGNRPRDIRRILLSDNVTIHRRIDELQTAGF